MCESFLMICIRVKNWKLKEKWNNEFQFAALRYLVLRDRTKHCMNKTNIERHIQRQTNEWKWEKNEKKSCAVNKQKLENYFVKVIKIPIKSVKRINLHA